MAKKITNEGIRRKEFTFKGKKIEELKKLGIREFAEFLPSRRRRFILRNFQDVEEFVNRAKNKIEKGKQVKTHKRDVVIVPEMIGMKIHVYNGRNFNIVEITEEMIGHTLGEFSLTRTRTKHTKTGVGATKGTKHKSKK